MLRRFLIKDNWRVIEARNGQAALERVRDERPQLILLDLMMPDMDGFEFVTALRRMTAGANIPVIVVTAKDLTESEHIQLSSQVQKIVFKGTYRREDLLSEVHQLIGQNSSRKSSSPILESAYD
jgi:DNA-binding response OmpR family regulator